MAAQRTRGRALAAEIYRDEKLALYAAGDGACSDRAVADRNEVDKKVVAAWGKPDSGLAQKFGDLLGDHKQLAINTMQTAIDRLERDGEPVVATNPEHEIMSLLTRVGIAANTAHDALALRSPGGEKVTGGEWGQFEADLVGIEREVRRAKLAARAAKKAAGR